MIGVAIFVAFAVALTYGIFRLLLWDTEGVTPDEALSPSARRRREQGVSEQDRLAHRAAFLRSCEDGVCCCTYHGPVWCAVHNSEGEAVAPDCTCNCRTVNEHGEREHYINCAVLGGAA